MRWGQFGLGGARQAMFMRGGARQGLMSALRASALSAEFFELRCGLASSGTASHGLVWWGLVPQG